MNKFKKSNRYKATLPEKINRSLSGEGFDFILGKNLEAAKFDSGYCVISIDFNFKQKHYKREETFLDKVGKIYYSEGSDWNRELRKLKSFISDKEHELKILKDSLDKL